jgi:hypothetical protein
LRDMSGFVGSGGASGERRPFPGCFPDRGKGILAK